MTQLKLFDQTEPRLDELAELEATRWRPIDHVVAELAQKESIERGFCNKKTNLAHVNVPIHGNVNVPIRGDLG